MALVNGLNLNHLSPIHRARAQQFFMRQSAAPHLAWMEQKFAEISLAVSKGIPDCRYRPEQIKPVNYSNVDLVGFYEPLIPHAERLGNVGRGVIKEGKLLVIDLVAGMATGFGGVAKGAVAAHIDPRYGVEQAITYLDIKLNGYLRLQTDNKKILPIAEMISDETEPFIIKNLEDFARSRGKELILIRDGASREEIEELWAKNKDRWNDCLMVALLRQPATLLISRDGKRVGKSYMKGHGDFFDVVQSQLKHIVEVMGIDIIFSSNIDNTGADISEVILGHVIEEFQQKQIQGMVELAEKYEGDKGGATAMIDGRLSILESGFLPKTLNPATGKLDTTEWDQKFAGMDQFPYFNTNTFWWKASALFDRRFDLPLMGTEKTVPDELGGDWLKIETIMGLGLDKLDSFKALIIDRGQRFHPAKFLTDLWVGRSDWMMWRENHVTPVMRDGKYVHKPILDISKNIFGSVAELNRSIFGYGSYDNMSELNALLMGGIGGSFNEMGRVKTTCGVSYVGNVVIMFEEKEDTPSGTLKIKGAKPSDRITLANTLILVPAGTTYPIRHSTNGYQDKKVDKPMLEKFIKTAIKNGKMTPTQAQAIVDSFFPSEAAMKPHLTLEQVFTEKKIASLTTTAKETVAALKEVFEVTGSLKYDSFPMGADIALAVIQSSKAGSAEKYTSNADGKTVPASAQKEYYLRHGDRVLVYSCQGLLCVFVPMGEEAILLTGRLKDLPDTEKARILSGKLDFITGLAAEDGHDASSVKEAFISVPLTDLLEMNSHMIYELLSGMLAAREVERETR